MEETVSPKKKLHYSWFVCVGCLLIFFLSCGLGVNNMSMYYPFMRERFSFSNTALSILSTSRVVGNICALSLVPAFYRRLDMRKGLAAALCILAVSFLLIAYAGGFTVFLIANALAGASYGLSCMVPLSMLLDRWFVKGRILAVSIACSGSGLATIGIPSLMTYVLKRYGIGAAAFMELGFVVLLGGTAILLIRDYPADRSILPYGSDEVSGGKDISHVQAEGEKKALPPQKTKVYSHIFKKGPLRFLPVYIVGICCGAACGCAYNHASLLVISVGHSVETSALAMSVIGLVLTAGKLLLGGISEKLGVYRPTMFVSCCWAAGLLLMCLSGLGKTVLFAGCVLFGMGCAMTMVCMVLWPKDWADGFAADILKQRMQVAYTITSMVFSLVVGISADLSGGSYVPIYLFFALTVIILSMMMVRNYHQAAGNSEDRHT